MGPASDASSVPNRPRFSWDLRSVPWTDGNGDQQEYAKAVKRWTRFQDNLADTNPNKIAKKNRGLVLLSSLYGRAQDLCDGIEEQVILAEADGVDMIVDAIYKRDALTVVNVVYNELQLLLSTKRADSETFLAFELRFAAQLSRFNALGAEIAIHASVAALTMLANANVDGAQRVSILAAAAPSDTGLSPRSSMNDFAKSIKYETIASVIRQCDKPEVKYRMNSLPGSSAHTATTVQHVHSASTSAAPAMLSTDSQIDPAADSRVAFRLAKREKIKQAKRTQACRRCGQYGHWWDDHNADGSLPDSIEKSAKPIVGNDPIEVARPAKGKTVSFNMANVTHSHELLDTAIDSCIAPVGPMVDNGAPYSAIGFTQLCHLSRDIKPDWNGELDEVPAAFADRTHWQYGNGDHASESRLILGSVLIIANPADAPGVVIRHLVLDGSSQWVVGRNVTAHSNILQLDGNAIVLPGHDDDRFAIGLIEHDMHIYLPLAIFLKTSTYSGATASTTKDKQDAHGQDWDKIKSCVDKVHKHVCGHSSFGDMQTLLERNSMWSADASRYLADIIARCGACRASARAKPARKVSLASMNRSFNDVVCVDFFFLDGLRCFHVMDAQTRYSAGLVCPDVSLKESVRAFETVWLAPFWPPDAVQGDDAFNHPEFRDMLAAYGTQYRPTPPRRHSKNVLESKHGIIRSIFIRLTTGAAKSYDAVLAAQMAIRISNDLYGSDTLSAFEMANGFTRPVTGEIALVPDELVEAQRTLDAKRKLTRIMRSKATVDTTVAIGDLVDIYIKNDKEKRGKWLTARTVLSFDPASWTVKVPASAGRTMAVSIEDIRPAIVDDSFSALVRQANDELDCAIDELLHAQPTAASSSGQPDDADKRSSSEGNFEKSFASGDENADSVQVLPAAGDNEDVFNDASSGLPGVGDQVDVFWPIDNAFYSGRIAAISNDMHQVDYLDGDTEKLNMADQQWRFTASTATLRYPNAPHVKSDLPSVLASLFDYFGNKPFMRHQAQGFPSFAAENAFDDEEAAFKKTVRVVPMHEVPRNANVVSSHVLYKIKINDDSSMKLKARIAPHGNEDSLKHDLKSDCSMCSPVGMRILLSTASFRKWRLTKLDVKSAFLQTGAAERDVFVIPPRESSDRGKLLWLLLTAAYGLINANAKWQSQSDELLLSIGFEKAKLMPQLFTLRKGGRLVVMLAKVVDDFLLAGTPEHVNPLVDLINNKFELGTIAHGPGLLRYFGLNIRQFQDMSISIDGDDKLEAIEVMPMTRVRRSDVDQPLNSIEAKAFASVNSSVGWLGITASPFCAEFSSRLQQSAPGATVKTLIDQASGLKKLKTLGSTVTYPRIDDKKCHSLSVLVFSDAGRHAENGQLCYVAGLLVDEMAVGSIWHVLSWSSHKSKRPVRSIGAAEIIAAGEAIDEGKFLAATLSDVYGIQVKLFVAVDSRDLFSSLSTQRNSIDKSIRADVNVIRYEFERKHVSRLTWIPGKTNLADPGTKQDSPLQQALQLSMADGRLALDFEMAESRDADRPLG